MSQFSVAASMVRVCMTISAAVDIECYCLIKGILLQVRVRHLHWTIKEKLGDGRPQCNYIYYWLAKISHVSWDPGQVDKVTVGATVLTGMISLFLNGKDYLL